MWQWDREYRTDEPGDGADVAATVGETLASDHDSMTEDVVGAA